MCSNRAGAAAILIALAAGTAWGSGAGSTGAPVLRISPGARPQAMGGAYTGVADDLSALFWNPAGLALLSSPEAGALYTAYLAGTSHTILGYAQPTGRPGVFAGAASFLDYGSQPRTVAAADGSYAGTSGTVSAMDTFVTGGWGLRLPGAAGVSIGAALKVVMQRFADKNRSGLGVDVGGLVPLPARGLKIGAVAQNLGAITPGAALLPVTFRLGAAYEIPVVDGVRTLWAADGEFTAEAGTRAHLGGEITVVERVALRGGFVDGGGLAAGGTFGAGFIVPGEWVRLPGVLRVDYAGGQAGDFGFTHRVQILFRFGGAGGGKPHGFKLSQEEGKRWLTWQGGGGPWEVSARHKGDDPADGVPVAGGPFAETKAPLSSLSPGVWILAVRRAGQAGTGWARDIPVDLKVTLPALAPVPDPRKPKTTKSAAAARAADLARRPKPSFTAVPVKRLPGMEVAKLPAGTVAGRPLQSPSRLRVEASPHALMLTWMGWGPNYVVFMRRESELIYKVLNGVPRAETRATLPYLAPGRYSFVVRAVDPYDARRTPADSRPYLISVTPPVRAAAALSSTTAVASASPAPALTGTTTGAAPSASPAQAPRSDLAETR